MGDRTVIGNVWYNERFFSDMFKCKHLLVDDLEDLNNVDLLVFWGGEDINPKIYEEKPKYTFPTQHGMERDRFESLLFHEAISRDIPIVGICRGAQLCCALSGGKLWQDVKGHTYDHKIRMPDGEIIQVTSTHHQMMRPGVETEVIAISDSVLSPTKYNQDGPVHNDLPEPEICYDNKTGALMIQGHPEYASAKPEFRKLVYKLVTKYFGDL